MACPLFSPCVHAPRRSGHSARLHHPCATGKVVCSVQILESAAKAVVTAVISSIPFIGGFLSGIIGLFWGGGETPSIWDQVNSKVLASAHILHVICALWADKGPGLYNGRKCDNKEQNWYVTCSICQVLVAACMQSYGWQLKSPHKSMVSEQL